VATGGIRPTAQQQAVVDACVSGAGVVIEAGAGTGKTSTLQAAAVAMGGRSGVYLAYNRVTADSARSAFPAGVECVTAHALAYRAIGWQYQRRLSRRACRMPDRVAAAVLGIEEPVRLGPRVILSPAHLAVIALGTVERFCYSADSQLSAAHVPPVNGLGRAASADLTWHILPYAERAWYDLRIPRGLLPFQHDHYLKMWQLTRPRIAADFIMFDEAQDANPVTAAIVQSQREAQLIAVGDSCQAIYGWRGAVDALRDWPAERRLRLTQSFRFGPAVAAEANGWLSCLDAPFRLSGTDRIASAVGAVADPDVVICRTNAEALVQARSALDAGRRVALAGGGDEIRALATAALDLQAVRRTSHPELAAFGSWEAVQEFVRTDASGADLAASVRLIDRHGAAMVLATVSQLSGPRHANVTVTTAHRAKGLEWRRVRIAADFPVRKRADAMLAYVAVTRARDQLDTSGLPPAPARQAIPAQGRKIAMKITANAVKNSRGAPRPYLSGRAQAESASRIIETDFQAFTVVGEDPYLAVPLRHPCMQRFIDAWHKVGKYGLSDNPGTAAVRYMVLAHTAHALAEVPAYAARPTEANALNRLATHAHYHAERLHATAEQLFLQSDKAVAYADGQAADGSRLIAREYKGWSRTYPEVQAALDRKFYTEARQLASAWDQVRQPALNESPKQMAGMYQDLADAAYRFASNYPQGMPSAALPGLMQIATHAGKHAIRLEETAKAWIDDGYRDLPETVAETAQKARTTRTRAGGSRGGQANARAVARHEDIREQSR
jgi:hypothetical protein